MAARLTDKLIKGLPAPTRPNQITFDTEVRGFGIRVTAAGARSFVLNYRVAGRERRYTIGSFPDLSVATARAEARALKQRIGAGEDPLSEKVKAREAPTLLEMWEEYQKVHLPKKAPRAQDDERSMWEKHILPRLGRSTKVADVDARDIDGLHTAISKRTPVRANRVVEVLRKAFNLAVRWEWRPNNPCVGVARNPEEPRHRYLRRSELARLAEVLATHPEQTSCNAIRLLLLTGARRGEVLGATWDMFDFEEGIWTKPSSFTKQRRLHRVPLSGAALQLLLSIKETSTGAYVFPSPGGGRPLGDIKHTWETIRRKADIADVRLHDLRHTYASILVSAGHSLPIIGALLGHSSPKSTARYSHLYDDPLRLATEGAAGIVTGTRPDPDTPSKA